MSKHIGIVACSAEGAALCYRTICLEAPKEMGEDNHPEVTMHTHSLASYMDHIRKDDWEGVARLMVSSARKLAQAGADFAVCPDNTIHQAYSLVVPQSPIPWLHIADAVGREAKERGLSRLGILGTQYLMTGPVYPETLRKFEISCVIPEEEERNEIDRIIFKELVKGLFPEESRLFFNEIIRRLKGRGCDGAVLGCTEIPLIVNPKESPLPVLDSTRLLARAAIRMAIGNR